MWGAISSLLMIPIINSFLYSSGSSCYIRWVCCLVRKTWFWWLYHKETIHPCTVTIGGYFIYSVYYARGVACVCIFALINYFCSKWNSEPQLSLIMGCISSRPIRIDCACNAAKSYLRMIRGMLIILQRSIYIIYNRVFRCVTDKCFACKMD